MSEHSDRFEPLLEAAREGDERAWATLYRELAPAVLGYLRGSNAPEPEDVLSEVFLQAARDLPRFEGGERDFRAWVFTVAHHRVIDARRAAARRPAEPVAEPPEPEGAAAPGAAEAALSQVALEEMHEGLAALTEDQRAVLLLRILGDLTVEEVAGALGKRPGAIKALQRRGLAALRRHLVGQGVTL
jgi:RNA polymerase sigma factor (sigma-70 family)